MSSPLLSSCLLMVAFDVPLKELTEKSESLSLTQRSYRHRVGLSLSDAGLTSAIGGDHQVWQSETETDPDFVVGERGVATTAVPEQYGGWVKFRDGLLSLLKSQMEAASPGATIRCILRYRDIATVPTAADIQTRFRWPVEPLIDLPSPTSEIVLGCTWGPNTPAIVTDLVPGFTLRVTRQLQHEILSDTESQFHGIVTLDVEAEFPLAGDGPGRVAIWAVQLNALHANSKRFLWHLVSEELRSNPILFDDEERTAFGREEKAI